MQRFNYLVEQEKSCTFIREQIFEMRVFQKMHATRFGILIFNFNSPVFHVSLFALT